MADDVVHLFEHGNLISLCCHMHIVDRRMVVGTFDRAACTCPKLPTDDEVRHYERVYAGIKSTDSEGS